MRYRSARSVSRLVGILILTLSIVAGISGKPALAANHAGQQRANHASLVATATPMPTRIGASSSNPNVGATAPLPQTGGGSGSDPLSPALPAGVVMVVAGLALRRASRR